VATLSSSQFFPEPPWPKIDRGENNFETAGPQEVSNGFERQAWEPPVEIVPTETISSEPESSGESEDDLAEPIVEEEPMVQLRESELEIRLKEAREHAKIETEKRLKAEYEESTRLEKEKLLEFFEALIASKDSNQELSIEVCNLAFKVGELLAKTELLTNRAIVSEFVETVFNEITEEGGKTATIFANPQWEGSIKELHDDQRLKHIDFKSDESMGLGSVRISLGNGGIEDIFDQRASQLRDQIIKAASEENTNLIEKTTDSRTLASDDEEKKSETIAEDKEISSLEKQDD